MSRFAQATAEAWHDGGDFTIVRRWPSLRVRWPSQRMRQLLRREEVIAVREVAFAQRVLETVVSVSVLILSFNISGRGAWQRHIRRATSNSSASAVILVMASDEADGLRDVLHCNVPLHNRGTAGKHFFQNAFLRSAPHCASG